MLKKVVQNWKLVGTEIECTTEELLKRLLRSDMKIIVLDGYSGCGKTMLLRRMREVIGKKMHIFSDEQFVSLILDSIRGRSEKNMLHEVFNGQGQVICIEDVDLYRGKIGTQEELAFCLKNAVHRNLIIVTGIDMYTRVPDLMERLNGEVWHADRENKPEIEDK